jgi:AraC-like DNA-binding protein
MVLLADEMARASDSKFVVKFESGRTVGEGAVIRPAEYHWHMVFARVDGRTYPIVAGPLRTSGIVNFTPGVEILWIKFKPGTFMPHLPFRQLIDVETALPTATSQRFWLYGSSWEIPDFENADAFIKKLVREGVLVCDPLVGAVLEDKGHDLAPRTVRHRFLRATGLTRGYIRQIERAQRAAAMLRQGATILDTVEEAGYFDQPHLTRSLKAWVGYTPAQLVRDRMPRPCRSIQDGESLREYDTNVLEHAS